MADRNKLEERIITECMQSDLTYEDVIRAIHRAEWFFLSRAETTLKGLPIRMVSQNKPISDAEKVQTVSKERADNLRAAAR